MTYMGMSLWWPWMDCPGALIAKGIYQMAFAASNSYHQLTSHYPGFIRGYALTYMCHHTPS